VTYDCFEQGFAASLVSHCDKVVSSPLQLILPENFSSFEFATAELFLCVFQ
jgi:hypothetical protein